jgi:hypothetical protein
VPIDDPSSSSLLLSSGIAFIALFLGLRQWYESRARDKTLSDPDRAHFIRQDVRRGLGVVVMLALALGLYLGSRVPFRAAQRPNPTFVEVWLAIIALLVVLLVLAMLDWVATRIYARRQRQLMARERQRMLREVFGSQRNQPSDHPADANEE